MNIDLTEHEGLIHNLMYRWNVDIRDADDCFQDFAVYYYHYRDKNYDAEKSKATTFLTMNFKNFMLRRDEKLNTEAPLLDAIHAEDRDKEYLDREMGGYEHQTDNQILIAHLLKDATQDTLNLLSGEVSFKELAKRDNVSRQSIQARFHTELGKLRSK